MLPLLDKLTLNGDGGRAPSAEPTEGLKRSSSDPNLLAARQAVRGAKIFGQGPWNVDELDRIYSSTDSVAEYRKLVFDHLVLLRDRLPDPATSPAAAFARVDTAAGASPNAVNLAFPSQQLTEADYEQALQTLVPVVRYMYEYKQTVATAKMTKLNKRIEPRNAGWVPKATTMLENTAVDHGNRMPLLVRPQPSFLPLRVAAPPRKGKSAYALLLASIAMRLDIRVLYSVAPNKRIPIAEMMNKIRTLKWDDHGVLHYSIDELMDEFVTQKTDICSCTYDQFNILFYSKDTPLSDVERIGALLDSWLTREDACVLHIHDEAQALAKNSQQGEDCHVERPPPPILSWLRRYYSNMYNLVLLVTATHLPVLQESALFGYTGSTSQKHAVAPVGAFNFDPENAQSGDSVMDRNYANAYRQLPDFPAALVPPPTPTYYGADYLTAWSEGGVPQYVEMGKLEPQTIGPEFATPSLEVIRAHFREWLATKPFELTPYNVSGPTIDAPLTTKDGMPIQQIAKPIYLACPTREVTTLTGQRQWMANFFIQAHIRTVSEGGALRAQMGDTMRDYGRKWWDPEWQKFRNAFGVAFFNFGSTSARERMQANLNIVADDLGENNLHDNTRLGVEAPRAKDQRILVYVYDPTHYLNVMDPVLTPFIFVYAFDDVKTAMRAIRAGKMPGKKDIGGYSIDKFGVIGYTMLTAGATIQDTTQVEYVDGQYQKTYYVPSYALVALTNESPLDEQLQLVGRTFVELHDAVFPPDYKIKLLSVQGESERLAMYANIERYYAEAGVEKIYKVLRSVYTRARSLDPGNPTRELGRDQAVYLHMMNALMGKRRGLLGDILGLPAFKNSQADPNAVGGFGANNWGADGAKLWSRENEPSPQPAPAAPGGAFGWLRGVWN